MNEWSKELNSVSMVQHALAYARKGWHVMPLFWCVDAQVCACRSGSDCSSPGKHPLTSQGVKNASTNPRWIQAWWQRWPYANIGLATGKISGFVVLDVDGDAGKQSMAELLKKHGRPEHTVASITGSGGRHVLWRYPEQPISNRVRVAPGLDVRSDGGHIVAPPSLHAMGARYSWHHEGHPARVRLATLPTWLADAMTGRPAAPKPTRIYDASKPKPRITLESVPVIPEGNRNRKLFELGSRMRWEGRDDLEVEYALSQLNANKCQPPLDEREVHKIVRSICGRYAVGQ